MVDLNAVHDARCVWATTDIDNRSKELDRRRLVVLRFQYAPSPIVDGMPVLSLSARPCRFYLSRFDEDLHLSIVGIVSWSGIMRSHPRQRRRVVERHILKTKVSVQKSEGLDKLTGHCPPSLYHSRNESGDSWRNTRMTMEKHARHAYDDAVTRHSIERC